MAKTKVSFIILNDPIDIYNAFKSYFISPRMTNISSGYIKYLKAIAKTDEVYNMANFVIKGRFNEMYKDGYDVYLKKIPFLISESDDISVVSAKGRCGVVISKEFKKKYLHLHK
ncbi:MAG TPA: hypothetical protein PKV92_08585 [Thermodesulfovibrio thiophilus]|nr:hypothetical protein [Thermodesulfovibrio thiophilus]HQD37134.1 hypothetical protein [Thermodesulfovibrio thiophilus]